jgi:TonB-dependent receptor
MLLTLQYNKSKKREQMEERVVTFSSGTDSWAKPLTWVGDGVNGTRCLETDPCVFNDHGGLQSGTLVQSMDAWMGTVGANTGAADPAGNYTCYDWTCKDTSVDGGGVRGTGLGTASRYSDSTNDTSDIGLNFKWDVTDRLKLNFDIQHVEATQTNYDIEGALNTYANPSFDLTGNHPIINAADGASFNDIDDPDVVGDALTNPGNYSAHHIMDHVTDSEGHMDAVRADLQYSFDSPWLNSLKAGVRYADREQTVRWTTYNWKSNVNSWSDYSADNFFITGSKYPAGGYEMVQWNQDFYGGGATNLTELPYMTMAMLKDRAGLAAAFGNQSYQPMTNGAVNSNEWIPICSRAGEDESCFLPAELSDVSEKTKAAYIQLKFGGPDATIFNGVTVTGNIGVRYVETQNTSTGGVNYSTMTYAPYGTSAPPAGSPPGTPDVYNWSYFISGLTGTPPEVDPLASPADQATQLAARIAYVNDPANFTDDRAFLTKSTDKATVDVTHKNWLPSFNVRFGLTDKWFLRFAASRALSRPDIGNLKAYSSVGAATPSAADLVCGKAFECTGGVPTKANIKYTGSAQNPYLRPVTADQFDLSVENYFSSTGSVTFNLFYKKFHDYIQFGTYDREFTNNGVTRSVQMNGPMNGDGASIKGFELAYQSFFDFLPAPFDGFGIQANYTHLHNTGINGAAVKKETAGEDGSSDPDIGGVKRSADNTFLNLPLESLSDDSYNLIGMYEKGAWSARLAYNWRSKFMVTAQDCCTTFPVWQDASGYLDGRVAFRVNEHIELSVEGSNLLSTETKLYQQVDGPTDTYPDGKATFLPSSWFKNDRRLTASIRLKY